MLKCVLDPLSCTNILRGGSGCTIEDEVKAAMSPLLDKDDLQVRGIVCAVWWLRSLLCGETLQETPHQSLRQIRAVM